MRRLILALVTAAVVAFCGLRMRATTPDCGCAADASVRPPNRGVAGLQDGWAVDPQTDRIILTSALAHRMACGGAKWIRLHFRLGDKHTRWDDEILAVYDQVVRNCREAGLQIIGLANHESWPGEQKDWVANSQEAQGGSGDNPYIRGYVENAVLALAKRYRVGSRVLHWEIWNEPNVWTATNPEEIAKVKDEPGKIGGSYVYPSNFAWMLRRVYEGVKQSGLGGVTVISGGLLCADFTGTCDDSGRVYLRKTYEQGNARAGWEAIRSRYGSYPMDAWGLHVYVSQAYRLDAESHLAGPPKKQGADLYRFYLDCFHEAALALDGHEKKVFLTEWGWESPKLSQKDQADNIRAALEVYETTAWIAAATYFKVHDEASVGKWGLRTVDDKPKQAWTDFCTAAGGTCCRD